ncbi:MAE_28990/MAE_18760 family HEPN-like nuclease [Micromonospora echinofusca]|uniref:MAE_28990/MAE_18760 family HEPN-like nuclease n=1 Tax=Micromonospora echinofusca TaxID=47858 RepID=UPI0034067BDE
MTNAQAARVRADLENELSWRRDEIRNLRNLGGLEADGPQRACRRRALLVLLYAHMEGFVKFALEQYAQAINFAQLSVKEVKSVISAAALSQSFKSYRSTDSSDAKDPSGNRARQVLRDAELIESIFTLQSGRVRLEIDAVTSADSNLSTSVLRRNMALLGLDDAEIHRFASSIEGLLKMRNNIAHGENINFKADGAFIKLEARIFGLCEELMRLIYESVRDEAYKMK